MATFKNEEDDATFWERLITDEQRAAAALPDSKKRKASAAGDNELAPRNARRGGPNDNPNHKGAILLRAQQIHHGCAPNRALVMAHLTRRHTKVPCTK